MQHANLALKWQQNVTDTIIRKLLAENLLKLQIALYNQNIRLAYRL